MRPSVGIDRPKAAGAGPSRGVPFPKNGAGPGLTS